MSSISSVSCMNSLASYSSVKNTQKSDSSSLVDKLFAKLDTKQQGFVDKSELQAALTSTTAKATGSSSGDDLFAKMDADGDGKITKQEMGNTLDAMLSQMDNLAAQMRVHGAAGGNQDDKGFSKDELVQIGQDTSTGDSKRSAFMSKLADNFDKADSDGNGKITRDEAISYAKASGAGMGNTQAASGSAPPPPPAGAPGGMGGADKTAGASTTAASSSTDPADTNDDGTVSASEALSYLLTQLGSEDATTAGSINTSKEAKLDEKIARQIMQLVQAYGSGNSAANDESSNLSSNLSASA